VLPDGVSKSKIVKRLNAASYPADWNWASRVGEAGWSKLRDFVNNGGTLVAYGSATSTATNLLDLPLEPACRPTRRPSTRRAPAQPADRHRGSGRLGE